MKINESLFFSPVYPQIEHSTTRFDKFLKIWLAMSETICSLPGTQCYRHDYIYIYPENNLSIDNYLRLSAWFFLSRSIYLGCKSIKNSGLLQGNFPQFSGYMPSFRLLTSTLIVIPKFIHRTCELSISELHLLPTVLKEKREEVDATHNGKKRRYL